jgi:hypothetical protein
VEVIVRGDRATHMPLRLQGHGHLGRYRNIWLRKL